MKCEPEDVVYQLDYNQDGAAHKEEYVQMFRDCGWEYFTDFAGYSYFRRPASDLREGEGIFCDDSSRLEMMRRVLRGRMVPLFAVFFCIIIPQILFQMGGDTVWNGILTVIYLVLFTVYVIIFVRFALEYLAYRKNIR